jgi:hypothetical protein
LGFVVLTWFEHDSGKSTQIPQYLAEEMLLESDSCGTVICTQVKKEIMLKSLRFNE